MNKSGEQLEKNPHLSLDSHTHTHTHARTAKTNKKKEDYERTKGAEKLLLSIIRRIDLKRNKTK